MRFVDVKNDYAFRKIFGNEQKTVILISFLNAVLGLEGSHRIVEVQPIDPFQLARVMGEKTSIIDVRARDGRGVTFIVEMQVVEPRGFEKRVLYYSAKDYAGQIFIGDDYTALQPVYFIGILNFNFFNSEPYFSTHLITDQATGANVLSDIQFRFIELPKFHKREQELDSIIDQWTYFIKNAITLDVIPDSVTDKGLKEAYKQAATIRLNSDELDAYLYASLREHDLKNAVLRGEERGEEQKAIAIAKNLLALKTLSHAEIAAVTGLSEADIANI